MIAPRLQLVTGFASGTVVETLNVLSATTTEQLDNNDSAAFRITLPTRTALTLRTPLRFRGSDGIIREYRVRRFVRDPLGKWADIECAPPLLDLSTAGLVRQTVNGTLYTSFGLTLTVAQWITSYVLTNLSADGLTWLDTTLGTIDSTQLVTLTFSQWTRLQLLRALAEATGLELELTQPSAGALYRISLFAERASTATPIRIAQSGKLISLSVESNDDGLATVVQPLGDVPEGGTEPATIANHLFTVTSIASGWVALIDSASGTLPVAFDDMVNSLYLEFLSGTTTIRRAISDSRAVDGAVQLADTTSLQLGMSVRFVADANGTPVTTLNNPAAIAQFGRVVVPITVAAMRGEANTIPNANFATGAALWSAPSAGWLEPYVASENVDLVGAMNGSKTAGAPATLAVDGLPANAVIRRGERIEVASLLLATSSSEKVIPSTGNVTVPLSGTLAQNVGAGAVLRVYDGNGVLYFGTGLTANGAQSSGASTLAISAPTYGTRPLTAGDQVRFVAGGTYTAQLLNGNAFDNTLNGSAVVWSPILDLATPLINSSAMPISPTFAGGEPLTVYSTSTGQYYSATVHAIGYTAGDMTIRLDITVPAGAYVYLPHTSTLVTAVQTTSETKTITNSTTEWPDAKQLTVTWSGGLTVAGASRIEWLTSAGALIGELIGISGVTGGSTSAVLRNNSASVIPAGSLFYSQPETLYCGATSVVNGLGVVTITLQTANTSSLADNAPVRIVRNTAGWFDQGSGSQTLLRSSTGWTSGETVVSVPTAQSRLVWAQFAAQFWYSRNDFVAGSAALLRLDLVNAATNAVIATVTSDPLPFATAVGADRPTPMAVVVKVQAELLATTRVKLVAYPQASGGGVDFTTKAYAMASWAMLTEGVDPNVPFIPGSHANTGWVTGVRYLKEYAKEVRSISVTAAQLADITGGQIVPSRVVCGVRINLTDLAEQLRTFGFTRDHVHPQRSAMVLQSPQRTASRLLGTGSAASGSGTVTSVSGGTSGGTGGGSSSGITVADDSGQSIPGVQVLTISGLGVALAANGAQAARLTIPSTVDPTGVDAVVSGGAWMTRDLVTQPGYDITIAAGTGLIGGKLTSWSQSTVTTPTANALVYVDAAGIVRTRAAGAPETLSAAAELLLYRTYVDVATYGNRIYAVAESRTFYRVVPRAPLFLKQRVVESEVTSGTWNNAIAVNSTGDINWYFANLGLYPFVEELPTLVKDHLDVQIAKFYGSGGTANSAPTWNSVHGTTWAAGFLRWPYDVGAPRGTPTVKRADSHDAYAATFLRLAARYAQVASGGLTWWDTNIAAIQDCAYYNIIVPVRLVNGGAGYLTDTFQDANVYPFNQTLDNVESYRGLKDALDLMTARGGAQATWAATYSGTPANLLAGIQSQWSASANANGETEWLSVAWDKVGAVKLTNQMTRFYPDLSIGVPVAIYDVPLSSTDSIARDRLDKLFRWLNSKASTWYMSRKYDLYPWGMLAASAAKVGYRDLAERWLSFVQTHHAYDSPGYLLIHDIGWARYVERVLNGDSLT